MAHLNLGVDIHHQTLEFGTSFMFYCYHSNRPVSKSLKFTELKFEQYTIHINILHMLHWIIRQYKYEYRGKLLLKKQAFSLPFFQT